MPPRKRKAAPEPEPATIDLEPSKMKVTELKEELTKRGLDTSGKKADLVARLEENLEDNDGPSPPKKPKATAAKPKATAAKPKATAAKPKATAAKPKATAAKPKATAAKATAAKPKATAAKPKATAAKPKVTTAKATTAKAPAKKKTVKEEPAAEGGTDESDFSKAVRELTSAKSAKKKTSFNRKVDSLVPSGSSHQVFEDWDCMLNQTNIGHNNNKFYVIQLLQNKTVPSTFCVFMKWGRVGESGANDTKMFTDLDAAKKLFCKKFQDKTKNKWDNRDSFTAVPGKYTLLEMDDDDDDDDEEVRGKLAALDEIDGPAPVVKSCDLDKPTQNLIKLIFDNDMFNNALKSLEIDTKKMPLGKLSKVQIAKGFEALEAIETAIKAEAARPKLAELTSKFYTIIPHDFGRKTPSVIADSETLQKKFDMLVILGDIEIAQGLQQKTAVKKEKKSSEVEEVPHPLDVNYQSLKADLVHVEKTSAEYTVLEKYLSVTAPQWRKLEILDVWKVDRDGASDRFKSHDAISNRRLLWHGTNVAVVAAILKSGLRIMPHSGGRVGKGIYFASECSKSAGYVRTSSNGTGIMFLNEVALGKEHHITMDDWTLTHPPSGFDCVIAKGRTEPDPKADTSIVIQDKKIVVPQGKPIPFSEYSGSSFSQSEYLVYKENQAQIRYLLKLKFS